MDGHGVRVAHSGPEGLASVWDFCPRSLPAGPAHLDDYAVAKALRAQTDLSGMVIVAVSGYGQPSDREKTHAAGFDAHRVEPIACRMRARALDAQGR